MKSRFIFALALSVFSLCSAWAEGFYTTKKSYPIDGHPESVVYFNGAIYFSCVGKELKPMERDGDGYIGILEADGTIHKFGNELELDAPKGMVIEGKYLYVTDIDKVKAFDLTTGSQMIEADLSPERVAFLNDLVITPSCVIVSATDKNVLYKVEPLTSTYAPLVTSIPLVGPNGMVWDPVNKKVIVCEYATSDKGKHIGRILTVDPSTGETEVIFDRIIGQFDGLALKDGKLYISDWSQGKKPEAILEIDVKTGARKPFAAMAIEGPADMIIEQGALIVPGMIDKHIHVIPLPEKK